MMTQTKVLVSGHIGHDPLGRQVISFIGTFLRDERNEVYLDSDWLQDKNIFEKNQSALDILKDVWGEELIKKIKFSADKPDDFEYDFMIYPWLMGVAPDDKRYAPSLKKNSKIKICYPVYDGSVPPLEWIDMINNDFDICITPSKYCAHNLKRYGLTIDCFGMEFEVLCKDVLNIKKHPKEKNGKFRFGCIAAIESRKNLPLVVKSFAKAFKKTDNVELVLQSADRNDLFASAKDLKQLVASLQDQANITLSTEFVSHKDMLQLIASFDAYVIGQTTSGFYTTAIEAFAAGLPVILSDIPVHREVIDFIPEKNNVFFAKHDIPEPEFHVAFNYRHLGVKFQGTESEYVKQFRSVYEKRNQLYTPDLIEQRKQCVYQFIGENIAKKNNMLLHPDNIVISDISDVREDCFYMSEELYKKYQTIDNFPLKKNAPPITERIYPEEKTEQFKAIEKVSLESQKIAIKLYKNQSLLKSKWMQHVLAKAEKYSIKSFPRFLYRQFSLYCKIKGKRKK